ncbi:phd zinc finger-containing protein [Stylonychia lemnae]|uniref:Phd zinc finger-containing protein n=1 Tax=Stylonychia lemnae TaxID=5949 RepID=A0A078A7L5_STYLE|nr:phd zinc finger-containing protein [Stylonychia lemnae]|eukprot:CDW78234.1 phd zinc finger-containing protein [Stylonychia lemnae]
MQNLIPKAVIESKSYKISPLTPISEKVEDENTTSQTQQQFLEQLQNKEKSSQSKLDESNNNDDSSNIKNNITSSTVIDNHQSLISDIFNKEAPSTEVQQIAVPTEIRNESSEDAEDQDLDVEIDEKSDTIANEPDKEVNEELDYEEPLQINTQVRKSSKYQCIVRIENEQDQNIRCDICLQYQSEDQDQLVICELCLVSVHQSCYGLDLEKSIPDHEWFCQRCQDLTKNPKLKPDFIKCGVCPNLTGILVKIQKPNSLKIQWAHPICINWNRSLKFEYYPDKNALVGDFKEFQKKVQRLEEISCYQCQKHEGYKHLCDYRKCTKVLHIQCAADKNIIYDYEQMIQEQLLSKEKFNQVYIFCEDHKKLGERILKSKELTLIDSNLREKICSKNPLDVLKRFNPKLSQKQQSKADGLSSNASPIDLNNQVAQLLPKKRGRKPGTKLVNKKAVLPGQQTLVLGNGNSSNLLQVKALLKERKKRGRRSQAIINELREKANNEIDQNDIQTEPVVSEEEIEEEEEDNLSENEEPNKRQKVSTVQPMPLPTAQINDQANTNAQLNNINQIFCQQLQQFPQIMLQNNQAALGQALQQQIISAASPQTDPFNDIMTNYQLQQQMQYFMQAQTQLQQQYQLAFNQQQTQLQNQTQLNSIKLKDNLASVLNSLGLNFNGINIQQVENFIMALGIQAFLERRDKVEEKIKFQRQSHSEQQVNVNQQSQAKPQQQQQVQQQQQQTPIVEQKLQQTEKPKSAKKQALPEKKPLRVISNQQIFNSTLVEPVRVADSIINEEDNQQPNEQNVGNQNAQQSSIEIPDAIKSCDQKQNKSDQPINQQE